MMLSIEEERQMMRAKWAAEKAGKAAPDSSPAPAQTPPPASVAQAVPKKAEEWLLAADVPTVALEDDGRENKKDDEPRGRSRFANLFGSMEASGGAAPPDSAGMPQPREAPRAGG